MVSNKTDVVDCVSFSARCFVGNKAITHLRHSWMDKVGARGASSDLRHTKALARLGARLRLEARKLLCQHGDRPCSGLRGKPSETARDHQCLPTATVYAVHSFLPAVMTWRDVCTLPRYVHLEYIFSGTVIIK